MNNRKLKDLNLLENQIKYKKTGNFFSAGVNGESYNLQEKIQEAFDSGELNPNGQNKKFIIAVNSGGAFTIIKNDLDVTPTATIDVGGTTLNIIFPGYSFIYQEVGVPFNLSCLYSQATSNDIASAGLDSNIFVSAAGTTITIEANTSLSPSGSTAFIYDFTYYVNNTLKTIVPTVV